METPVAKSPAYDIGQIFEKALSSLLDRYDSLSYSVH